MKQDRRIPGGRNFATLLPDEVNGVEYITDAKTGYRLFHHAPCRICGIREWRWSRRKRRCCTACTAPKANDNIGPGDAAEQA